MVCAFNSGQWTFAGVDVLGTFHSSFQRNKSNAPDLELMVMPLGLSKDNGIVLRKAMGISDEVCRKQILKCTSFREVFINILDT